MNIYQCPICKGVGTARAILHSSECPNHPDAELRQLRRHVVELEQRQITEEESVRRIFARHGMV